MDESEHVKEVYAHFGLAVYFAQVLEHGIVNALTVIAHLPSRSHATSVNEWADSVDAFMSRHFETTMGRMIRDLKSVTAVPGDLEELLIQALSKRNALAHDFFREHAEDFLSESGREIMIAEATEAKALFESADARLDEIVAGVRRAAGVTDEILAREYDAMLAKAKRG